MPETAAALASARDALASEYDVVIVGSGYGGAKGSRALNRWALVLLKLELFAFFVAAAAPSPLLVPFQHKFGFGAAMLTVIFATYAITLMVALLIVGGLSDHVGRKPVIIGALALETASMLIFLSATDVGWLLAGRAVQGIATGMVVGALNASILEAAPSDSRIGALINGFAPLAGLAVGGLAVGLLIQQFNNPVELTFISLAAVFAVFAVLTILVPETSGMRPGALASLTPRISMPRTARRTFLALLPGIVSLWAISGLYLSLVSPAMKQVYGIELALAGGLAIALLNASGAIAPLVLSRCQPATITVNASAALAIGAALIAVSAATTSVPVFFAGTLVAGAGFGLAFSASARQIMVFVTPDWRAATFASIYVVSYIAFSVPAMVAGALVRPFGLDNVLLVYSALVVITAVVGIATSLRERSRENELALAGL